jgi:ribosomal protein L7/L12
MPTTDRKLRVFLCHSSHDKPTVRGLYKKLQDEGWIDPWLDEENLLPGQVWEYEIEKALDDSDAVIVTLSRDSVTKEGYIQRELRFVVDIALEKPEETIFILPLRLEECEPPRKLRVYHYVDYFPKERLDWAYEKLRKSLEVRAKSLGILTTQRDLNPKPEQNAGSIIQKELMSSASVSPETIKPLNENAQYDLIMKDAGPLKINVIKIIRQLTNLGLGEAKNLAETINGKILSAVDAESASRAKSQFEEVGAVVEIAVTRNDTKPLKTAKYDVLIKNAGPRNIEVIKVIRQITNLGLLESKTLSETVGGKILSSCEKALAMDAKRQLEEAGATIEVKST